MKLLYIVFIPVLLMGQVKKIYIDSIYTRTDTSSATWVGDTFLGESAATTQWREDIGDSLTATIAGQSVNTVSHFENQNVITPEDFGYGDDLQSFFNSIENIDRYFVVALTDTYTVTKPIYIQRGNIELTGGGLIQPNGVSGYVFTFITDSGSVATYTTSELDNIKIDGLTINGTNDFGGIALYNCTNTVLENNTIYSKSQSTKYLASVAVTNTSKNVTIRHNDLFQVTTNSTGGYNLLISGYGSSSYHHENLLIFKNRMEGDDGFCIYAPFTYDKSNSMDILNNEINFPEIGIRISGKPDSNFINISGNKINGTVGDSRGSQGIRYAGHGEIYNNEIRCTPNPSSRAAITFENEGTYNVVVRDNKCYDSYIAVGTSASTGRNFKNFTFENNKATYLQISRDSTAVENVKLIKNHIDGNLIVTKAYGTVQISENKVGGSMYVYMDSVDTDLTINNNPEIDNGLEIKYLSLSDTLLYHSGCDSSAGAILYDNSEFSAYSFSDSLANYYLYISGGTGVYQSRKIIANTDSTLTVNRAFDTTLDNTSNYFVRKQPSVTITDNIIKTTNKVGLSIYNIQEPVIKGNKVYTNGSNALRFYGVNSPIVNGNYFDNKNASRWTLVDTTFTVPSGCTDFIVYMRSSAAAGVQYFDDLSVFNIDSNSTVLTNTDFELWATNTDLTDWAETGVGLGDLVEKDSTHNIEGDYCLKLTSGNNGCYVSQHYTSAVAGEQYRITFMLYNESNNGRLRVYDYSNSSDIIALYSPVVNTLCFDVLIKSGVDGRCYTEQGIFIGNYFSASIDSTSTKGSTWQGNIVE